MNEVTYNSEQMAVIQDQSRRTAVVAGPGSGKTQTLIGKINTIPIEDQMNLAVITFTTDAAAEIRSRLGTCAAFVGTLHAWCLQFLKRNGHLIGMPSTFSVTSQFDADDLMDTVLSESSGRISKSDLAERIQWGWFVKGQLDGNSEIEVAAAAFMSKLWAQNRVDYNGLLQLTYLILDEHAGKFPLPKMLFVDEAQDSSQIDWMIYEKINPDRWVSVGDPDQSIYGFRGAQPQLFIEWCLKADVLLKLETSYRCAKSIAGASNRLMDAARGRVRKSIISASKASGITRFNSFTDQESAGKWLLRWAKDREEGETWAVLCRTNREVKEVRSMFKAAGIEIDSEREQSAIGKLSAYMDVIAFPNSEVAAAKAMVVFRRDMQARQRYKFLLEARIKNVPPGDAIVDLLPELAAAPDIRKNPLSLAAWKPVLEAARFLDLKMIKPIIGTMAFGSSVEDLALEVAEYDEASQYTARTVRTIHRAKGREWDSVVITSVNEGNFPSHGGDEEEGRRLLFVAMTRAKSKLTCLYDQSNPSRFLLNIGV